MLVKSSFALLGALVALPMVYASLYPTFPTQDSVIPAGQEVVIRWKDDSHTPHLDKFGLLRVDLFLDNDANLVSTLAEKIKPTDEAAKIRIEKEFGADGSNYYIRFTPAQRGRAPIYTAKFTITGLTGSPNYRQDRPSRKNSKAPDEEKVNELDVGNVSNSTSTISLSSTSASNLVSPAVPTVTYSPPNLTWNTPPGAQETATLRPNYNGGSARLRRPADAGLGMLSLMYLMWLLLMVAHVVMAV